MDMLTLLKSKSEAEFKIWLDNSTKEEKLEASKLLLDYIERTLAKIEQEFYS